VWVLRDKYNVLHALIRLESIPNSLKINEVQSSEIKQVEISNFIFTSDWARDIVLRNLVKMVKYAANLSTESKVSWLLNTNYKSISQFGFNDLEINSQGVLCHSVSYEIFSRLHKEKFML
jgi:hypothetical protein